MFVDPPSSTPNTVALGTGIRTAVKGAIYLKYDLEKTYSGLENQSRYWGGGGQRMGGIGVSISGGIGGDDCKNSNIGK